MKTIAIVFVFLLLFLSACGIQPPLTHSEGPPLISAVMERSASAVVDRGAIIDVMIIPGMIRVDSIPLSFERENLPFGNFYVLPGDTVYQGQLLASLHIPHQHEQIANQQAVIERLNFTHNLAAEIWEIDFELMNIRYRERLNAAAETFDEAILADAQRLYFEMNRALLVREQETEWQRIERTEANTRLENMLADLYTTQLYAPFDGVITYTAAVNHGAMPGAGRRILYIAPNNGPLFVEYTASDLPRSRLSITQIYGEINGQRVELTYLASTTEELAYNALHGLPRRIRFALPEDSDFPLGASVRIFIHTSNVQDTLRIPTNALVGRGISTYVYRREHEMWIPVNPVFGVRSASFVEILDGLSEGDVVLVN
jgi:multidrug efflux pump subunit AcrA (membrane-fusion protein)